MTKLLVTIPYFSKMEITSPTGVVTIHKVIQNPNARTPFYVVLSEADGEILVLPEDQITLVSEKEVNVNGSTPVRST